MIVKKTYDELIAEMTSYLAENTSINYFGEGSIAKAIVAANCRSIANYYDTFEYNLSMAFVSTAQGRFLDLIGQLLDCPRRANESDENYRYRIIHQVYIIPGSNEKAIRDKCMQVDNVRKVMIRPHVKGAGSFSIYVDVIDYKLREQTLQAVRNVVNNYMALGIAGEVVLPRYVPLHFNVTLTFKKQLTTAHKYSILSQATQAIRDYINGLGAGEPFNTNQFIFHVLNANEQIASLDVKRFMINDRPSTFASRRCRWNEQFVAGEVEVS